MGRVAVARRRGGRTGYASVVEIAGAGGSDLTVRRARTADVREIRRLVDLYTGDRRLLAKTLVALFEDVQDFWVAEHDGTVVGCGAVHVLWEDLAEIRTVAVDPATGIESPGGPMTMPGSSGTRWPLSGGVKAGWTWTTRSAKQSTVRAATVSGRWSAHARRVLTTATARNIMGPCVTATLAVAERRARGGRSGTGPAPRQGHSRCRCGALRRAGRSQPQRRASGRWPQMR